MLKDGRPDEAAGEFQKAVRIDPSNQAARQELDIMSDQAGSRQRRPILRPCRKALKEREQENQPDRGEAATPSAGTACSFSVSPPTAAESLKPWGSWPD